MRIILASALLALVAAVAAAHASALPREGSAFALQQVTIERTARVPNTWLAQRAITREWGASDDSTYRVVDVPGWKSEGLAFGLSGAVPGLGQLYSEEGSGWLFMLGEAAGWLGRWYERRQASRDFDDAVALVGDPTDSSSTFSFARYRQVTGQDPSTLETLWSGDHNAFYRALADDPTAFRGFSGVQPQQTVNRFADMLSSHDDALQRSRVIETLLWLNHLGSALDALRAARLRNLPLREEYHLELGQRRVRSGRSEWRAALVRRF